MGELHLVLVQVSYDDKSTGGKSCVPNFRGFAKGFPKVLYSLESVCGTSMHGIFVSRDKRQLKNVHHNTKGPKKWHIPPMSHVKIPGNPRFRPL